MFKNSGAWLAYVVATFFYSGVWLGEILRWFQRRFGFKKQFARDVSGGTVGSVAAWSIFIIPIWDVYTLGIVTVLVAVVGTLSIPIAVQYMNHVVLPAEGGEKSFGHDGTERRFDFRRITIDEVLAIVLLVWCVHLSEMEWWGTMFWPLLASLVLFRVFDITKWPPQIIKRADAYFEDRGGFWEAFGVMLDDILAAVFAWIAIRIIDALISFIC